MSIRPKPPARKWGESLSAFDPTAEYEGKVHLRSSHLDKHRDKYLGSPHVLHAIDHGHITACGVTMHDDSRVTSERTDVTCKGCISKI